MSVGIFIENVVTYEDEYNCIIVVLCGEVRETADELKYKLKKRYGATSMPAFGFGPQKPRVEIVRVKEKSQSRKKREVTEKTRSPLDIQFSFDRAIKSGLLRYPSPFITQKRRRRR